MVCKILAEGKNSRLYKKLVDELQLATDCQADVVDLFDRMYNEAIDNGYSVDTYVNMCDWVKYKKESQAGYRAANGFDVTSGE